MVPQAIMQCLSDLQQGKAVNVPIYDFTTHQRSATEWRRVEPADVVIIEGILVLHSEPIRQLVNMRIYVDTDDDVRLARRIQRDVAERGRNVQVIRIMISMCYAWRTLGEHAHLFHHMLHFLPPLGAAPLRPCQRKARAPLTGAYCCLPPH